MQWVGRSSISKGVHERAFELVCDGRTVPGVLWTPEGATGPTSLVLIGHGGSGHKRQAHLVSLARRLVRRALVDAGAPALLVMGALSRGRIRDFVLGNTAEHMLSHAGVDILLVKPAGFETTVAEEMPQDLLTRPLYFPF